MKKLIIIAIAVLITACSKKEIQAPQQVAETLSTSPYQTFDKGYLNVKVESNFIYPLVSIELDTNVLIKLNADPSKFKHKATINYSYKLFKAGKYRVFIHANPGTSGSKYMNGSDPLWHQAFILLEKDTIKLNYKDGVQSEYYFNIR